MNPEMNLLKQVLFRRLIGWLSAFLLIHGVVDAGDAASSQAIASAAIGIFLGLISISWSLINAYRHHQLKETIIAMLEDPLLLDQFKLDQQALDQPSLAPRPAPSAAPKAADSTSAKQ